MEKDPPRAQRGETPRPGSRACSRPGPGSQRKEEKARDMEEEVLGSGGPGAGRLPGGVSVTDPAKK